MAGRGCGCGGAGAGVCIQVGEKDGESAVGEESAARLVVSVIESLVFSISK